MDAEAEEATAELCIGYIIGGGPARRTDPLPEKIFAMSREVKQ